MNLTIAGPDACQTGSYIPGATNGNLCSVEKFCILKANKNTIINKRSERKFLAANFDVRVG